MIFPGHVAQKAFPKISKYFNAGEWIENPSATDWELTQKPFKPPRKAHF
jgi:hypothetical protein